MGTKLGIRFIVVKTDHFSKLTRAVSVAKITASNIATIVSESLVIPYRAPDTIFTDNNKRFTTKFFAALRALLDTKLGTTSR